MRRSRILVIGGSGAELRTDIRRFPSGGETVFGDGYELGCSGSGFESSVALSKMGVEALCLSRIGEDILGEKLRASLDNINVDTRYLVSKKRSRTKLTIRGQDVGGRMNCIRLSGSCGEIEYTDIEDAFMSLPDAVLIHFDIDPELVVKATLLAREESIPVFIDAGPASSSVALGELENVAIIMLDESEIHAYTGISPDSFDNCGRACIELEKRVKAKYFVLKLGNRGAYLYDGKYFKFMPAYDVKAVDASCVGAAFDAAVISEYMRSGKIKYACELGCIAGAMTVMERGGAKSIPTLSQIRRFKEDNELDIEE